MRRALFTLAALLALGSPPLTSPAAADPPPVAPAALPAKPLEYPLDDLSRAVPDGDDLGCPRVEVAAYRGDVLRYRPEVWVNAAFKARLLAFERVVRDVGIEVYGRPPERILSLGGYGCRRMREHANLLSEHVFGNAIDIAGFDFGHLGKDERLPAGLDRTFVNGFGVRVVSDWGKKNGWAAVHARFLRTLIQRLAARDDVFRVLLGPGFPGHKNHFHFDMAPFRVLQVFEDGQVVQPAP